MRKVIKKFASIMLSVAIVATGFVMPPAFAGDNVNPGVVTGEWTEADTFTVHFEQPVKLADDAKGKIFTQKWGKDGGYDDIALDAGDSVSVSGSNLMIKFKNGYTNATYLHMEIGAVTDNSGKPFGEIKTVSMGNFAKQFNSIKSDKTALKPEGETITAKVTGKLFLLGDNPEFRMYKDGKYDSSAKAVFTPISDNEGDLKITVPANNSGKVVTYTVRTRAINSSPKEVDSSFKLTQAAGSGATPNEGEEGEATITKLSYSTTKLDAAGGEVVVTVTGKDLNKPNNFNYRLMTEMSGYKTDAGIELKTSDITATSAKVTFTVPANNEASDKVYTFRVKNGMSGFLKGIDGIDQDITVSSKGASTFIPVIEQAEWTTADTVIVTFKDEISLADGAAAKIKVGDKPLAAESIPVSKDKQVVIKFADGYKAEYSSLTFGAGSLKDSKGALSAKEVTAYPTVDKRVTKVSFNPKTRFDSKGGSVNVSIEGKLLNVGDKELTPVVYLNGKEATDVRMDGFQIMSDSLARMFITLPENNAEEDKNYELKFKVGADGEVASDIIAGNVPLVVEGKVDHGAGADAEMFGMEVKDWEATNLGDGTIVVQFNKPVLANDKIKFRDYVYFSDTPNSEVSRKLTDSDEVKLEDNLMTIRLADKDSQIPGVLRIKPYALRDAKGAYLSKESGRDHARYITVGAHINSMSFNKVTFTSEGGDVEIAVKGTQLNKSKEAFAVEVFRDNANSPDPTYVPEVKIVDDKNATIKMHLEPNDTDKTQVYRFKLKVNGINVPSTYIKGYDVVSVLPEGLKEDAVTLSSIDISAWNDADPNPNNVDMTITADQVSNKMYVAIRGTNLSSKKTAVRIVDENGVVWSAEPVFECGATYRWQNGSLYLPEKQSKNEQSIELLVPRSLGTTHTFTLSFAPDGKNFLDAPTAKVTVRNDGVIEKGGAFTLEELSVIKKLKVEYKDTEGNTVAEADEYPVYAITELYTLGIKPKNIKGYKLKGANPDLDLIELYVTEPDRIKEGPNKGLYNGATFFVQILKGQDITYIYEKDPNASVDPIPEPQKGGYLVKDGDNQSWTIGSDKDISIRFGNEDATLDDEAKENLEGVYLDGTKINDSNYTTAHGSVIVKLKSSFLNTLSANKHKVTAKFKDGGEATARLTVSAAKPAKENVVTTRTFSSVNGGNINSQVVRTGDSTELLFYAIAVVAAGAALAFIYRHKKISEKN